MSRRSTVDSWWVRLRRWPAPLNRYRIPPGWRLTRWRLRLSQWRPRESWRLPAGWRLPPSVRRPGLRTRVATTVALGALLISALVATLSFQLIRSSLLAERQRTAIRTAFYDASVMRPRLVGPDTDKVEVLSLLDTGGGRRPVLYDAGVRYALTTDVGAESDIPASLRRMVRSGQSGAQRVHIVSGPAIVIGVPLSDSTEYYEIVSLREAQDTLDLVGLVLGLVAAGTTIAGAGLGWYAAGRALRPLASVADAAHGIAAGDLTARLDVGRDRDLVQLTSSFNNMVGQLQQRIERDRRFAADVSHELRSPLQTLSAAATVLNNRRDKLDPRTAVAAELVAEEVDRFQRLVSELIDITRADAELEWSTVDIGALAREQCRNRGADPEIVSVFGRTKWSADARRLEQIIGNLVENAQRHGGGAVAVRLSSRGRTSTIEVDDAGPGVLPEERELIFSPFVRGRSAASRGDAVGAGLGLAIVARLAHSHGGRVTVLDRPGGGARFRVELAGRPM